MGRLSALIELSARCARISLGAISPAAFASACFSYRKISNGTAITINTAAKPKKNVADEASWPNASPKE